MGFDTGHLQDFQARRQYCIHNEKVNGMSAEHLIDEVVGGSSPASAVGHIVEAGLTGADARAIKAAAKEYGGSRMSVPKTTIMPGSLQQSYPTWVFQSQGDAEEFATYITDEVSSKLKTNIFKHGSKWSVEVTT
jgi:hypothetical protein